MVNLVVVYNIEHAILEEGPTPSGKDLVYSFGIYVVMNAKKEKNG